VTHIAADSAADIVSERGIYLYGLSRPDGLSRLNTMAGLGLQSDDGLSGVGVTAVHSAGSSAQLIALISEVKIADFSEVNLQTLAWVGTRAAQHEAVVAVAMGVSTVLPAKFATIFRSLDSLQQFMAKHGVAIESALDALHGKAEWSVKAYAVESQARGSIAAADAVIVSRRAALSDSPGARYMQQKKIDALIEMAVEKELARVSDELLQKLQNRAEASRALRCHSSAVTGRPERMIFNASFLLSEDAQADFEVAVAEQQAAYQSMGLTLELRGPWPPYNFCPDLSGATL
jgi:hypothetical protein